ncbi:MAG: hypothetical protein QOE62_126 [Actinomycetota bacterium]|jgi:hypothetical protein|nr:hypothetical protein [Actinomycetota bacterium]
MRKQAICILVSIALMIGATTRLPVASSGAAVRTTRATTHKPMFVHYYLWWDKAHWQSKSGTAYARALMHHALPAALKSNGCAATTPYPGNKLLDAPAPPLGMYSQDSPATFARQVQQASSAGIDGFVVSWAGNGQRTQTAASTAFSRRFAMLVRAVAAHNAVRGARRFALMLGYQGLNNSRSPRSATWIANDLAYFARAYGSSSVFHVPAYGAKPVVMFLGSRKFSVWALHTMIDPVHRRLTLIGDEHGLTQWKRGVASVFDGDGWYWSSQNPYGNPQSFAQLRALANVLHSQHKLWFSPLAVGYNKANFGLGGSCVPRKGAETLIRLYAGNLTSHPDGWMLISWNEYLENTYVEPSLRYGSVSLNVIGFLTR